ncbi:hypothetical protein, conserved [Babesia ovata]|uniref:Uncharacterized protein n=1 Tax=Babesia ovata TaxID=189622 RepID=A0A2H6KBH9_9APIC|nr:uncharacterized protein BOVATA_018390 [Babesia ovata]GBE60346.1 hypothetical protein, conserved [Babesia ovata]
MGVPSVHRDEKPVGFRLLAANWKRFFLRRSKSCFVEDLDYPYREVEGIPILTAADEEIIGEVNNSEHQGTAIPPNTDVESSADGDCDLGVDVKALNETLPEEGTEHIELAEFSKANKITTDEETSFDEDGTLAGGEDNADKHLPPSAEIKGEEDAPPEDYLVEEVSSESIDYSCTDDGMTEVTYLSDDTSGDDNADDEDEGSDSVVSSASSSIRFGQLRKIKRRVDPALQSKGCFGLSFIIVLSKLFLQLQRRPTRQMRRIMRQEMMLPISPDGLLNFASSVDRTEQYEGGRGECRARRKHLYSKHRRQLDASVGTGHSDIARQTSSCIPNVDSDDVENNEMIALMLHKNDQLKCALVLCRRKIKLLKRQVRHNSAVRLAYNMPRKRIIDDLDESSC